MGHLEQGGEVVAVAGTVEGALAGVEGVHGLTEADGVADEAEQVGGGAAGFGEGLGQGVEIGGVGLDAVDVLHEGVLVGQPLGQAPDGAQRRHGVAGQHVDGLRRDLAGRAPDRGP